MEKTQLHIQRHPVSEKRCNKKSLGLVVFLDVLVKKGVIRTKISGISRCFSEKKV